MPRRQPEAHVGTSGWNYKHWKGEFYPDNMPSSKWFTFYQEHFDTVEINNTFYNLPSPGTFRSWHDQARPGFLYAVKANRFITHMKKLKDPEESLKKFFGGVSLLKERCGPILFQLPPRWHKNIQRLKDFLGALPEGYDHVLEFRDPTWFSKDVYEVMEEHGVSFCAHDMAGSECPRLALGRLAYVRFHGSEGAYLGSYSKSTLGGWVDWLREQLDAGREVYAYFNNDVGGHAIRDAKRLISLVD